jgi:hypothetical protein
MLNYTEKPPRKDGARSALFLISELCCSVYCLKGCHFSSDAEVIAAAQNWLDGQHLNSFFSCLQKLDKRAKNCIELRGEYVE